MKRAIMTTFAVIFATAVIFAEGTKLTRINACEHLMKLSHPVLQCRSNSEKLGKSHQFPKALSVCPRLIDELQLVASCQSNGLCRRITLRYLL
uniref:Secreted protein n=1 Tax=Lutzomyia longipalpis TaxID=7200 RepID=A0A1B0CFN0_LUTLO